MARAGVRNDRYQQRLKEEGPKARTVRHPFFLPIGHKVRFAVQASRRLKWKGSDPSRASVTPDGLVEGLQPGAVILTAS